jgi:hypothetical protein
MARAPLFLKKEADQLKAFIREHVRHGDKRQLLYLIEHGKICPSKMLADNVAGMLQGKSEFVLIDDQKLVFETVLQADQKAQKGRKQVVIVQGGPGTGKTVVAVNLLDALLKRGRNARYVSKNAAPREVYARINLSYISAAGQEVVVFCPESRNATATLEPSRRSIHGGAPVQPLVPAALGVALPSLAAAARLSSQVEGEAAALPLVTPHAPAAPELTEQHFTIHYGDTGHSYESIVLPYLRGARAVTIEDPYIRATHQVQNFVRFCEAVIKVPSVRNIVLITSYDETTNLQELTSRLDELKQSLLELDVALDVKVNENLHDREIRIDNGWTVKIGRGLDFFQKPDSWFGAGASDISLRRCLETKVDIFC